VNEPKNSCSNYEPKFTDDGLRRLLPVYIYNWAAGSIKDTCFASVTCADWKYRYGMVY